MSVFNGYKFQVGCSLDLGKLKSRTDRERRYV